MRKTPGDFREYLRSEMDRGRARKAKPAPLVQPAAAHGRRPGAWPAGTRPPDPPPSVPEAIVAEALAEYRQWLAAGQLPGDHRCDCTSCQLLHGGTR